MGIDIATPIAGTDIGTSTGGTATIAGITTVTLTGTVTWVGRGCRSFTAAATTGAAAPGDIVAR